MKTLSECKDEVERLESERLKDNNRIFYPDPMEEDNCAQCGRSKSVHHNDYTGSVFFCTILKRKPCYELNDEAAELYAKQYKEENSLLLEEKAKLIETIKLIHLDNNVGPIAKNYIYSLIKEIKSLREQISQPSPEESQKELWEEVGAIFNEPLDLTYPIGSELSKWPILKKLTERFTIHRKK